MKNKIPLISSGLLFLRLPLLALLAIPLLLTACLGVTDKYASVPNFQKVHVPYTYKVKSFHDARIDRERTLEDMVKEVRRIPFNQQQFLRILVNNLNSHSIYSYDEAYLYIKLKDYAAIREGNRYIVTFFIDMLGEDKNGNLLAVSSYSCFQSTDHDFDLTGSFEDIFVLGDKGKENKQNKKWQDLYKKCLADVAGQFNTHILEGAKR